MKAWVLLLIIYANTVAGAAPTNGVAPATTPVPLPLAAPQTNLEVLPALTTQTNPAPPKVEPVRPTTRFSAAAKPPILGPVRAKRIIYGGAAVRVSQRPGFGEIGQLFNPFAPAEYGYPTNASFHWNPYHDARSWPRAFREEKDHEPRGFALFTVGF